MGLNPLTTRFVDVWDGIAAMAEVLATRSYEPHLDQPTRVT
jgi:kynureninase